MHRPAIDDGYFESLKSERVRVRALATLTGSLFTLSLALPAFAATPLLPIPELVCQQSTGNESLRFVAKLLKTERRCADAEAAGELCDESRRSSDVARALEKLGKAIASRCGDIILEHLGFPSLCDDSGGPPFTAAELTSCIEASHQMRVSSAIDLAYPGSAAALTGDDLRCQRAAGIAAEQFLTRRLRARQSCRNDQLSGGIAAEADCRAEPAPLGPGTGDGAIDRRLLTAAAKLSTRLARACDGVDLATLGYPGACEDADGAPFTLSDLAACFLDGHGLVADEMMAIEYPAP